MKKYRKIAVAFGFLSLLAFVAAANGANEKVEICHIPPGNPGNAHFITVGESAVPAHVANHGDEVVPGDGSCSVGVGECVVDGFLACTSDGLVCDAEPGEPPEEVEVTCNDGRDNDCDGLIDLADDDCSFAQFSETFPPSDQSAGWDAFEAQISPNVVYNRIDFFSDTDPGYTCIGPEADTICQAIRAQTDESCAKGSSVSVTCEDNVWTVGLCTGTELSINSPFCKCGPTDATIRAEAYDACSGGNANAFGAVNGDSCGAVATTMTVRCQ
jgi:hypothetical protein